MSRLTASKLELAIQCLYPFTDGSDLDGENVENMGAAKKGSNEHRYIEHTMRTGDVEPKSPTHARWIDDWYTAHGDNRDWHVEFALAVDPITARVVTGPPPEEAGPRYPWAPPGFIPATADSWCVVEGGASTGGRLVVVIDWKSGFRQKTHLSPARGNLQLWWLAIGLAELTDADEVMVEAIYVQPDGVWRDWHTIDVLELRELRMKVAVVKRALEAGTDAAALAPKWGPWCADKMCPKLGRCPATKGALPAVSTTDPRIAKTYIPRYTSEIRSMEHAAVLYQIALAARASLNELWGALRGWTDELGPIAVRPGFAWGRRNTTRERMDADLTPEAIAVLKEELGDHWEIAVRMKGAKGRVYEAARMMAADLNAQRPTGAKKITITSVEARCLERLRAVGDLQPKVTSRVDEWPVTENDVQNYRWLSLPPSGTKELQRVEDEDDPQVEEDGGEPWSES